MKTTLKISVLGTCSVLMFLIDAPPELPYPGLQFVPEAHAILGVRRRTAVRTAVVVSSADQAKMAQAQQQTAAAQQQAAAAQQQAAAAAPPPAAAAPPPAAAAPPPPPAAAPPATGAALPLGTVVAALPAGCTSTPVGGVEYFYCSGNFYRAALQGTKLVYVTAKP
jgi:hypothetical protein